MLVCSVRLLCCIVFHGIIFCYFTHPIRCYWNLCQCEQKGSQQTLYIIRIDRFCSLFTRKRTYLDDANFKGESNIVVYSVAHIYANKRQNVLPQNYANFLKSFKDATKFDLTICSQSLKTSKVELSRNRLTPMKRKYFQFSKVENFNVDFFLSHCCCWAANCLFAFLIASINFIIIIVGWAK